MVQNVVFIDFARILAVISRVTKNAFCGLPLDKLETFRENAALSDRGIQFGSSDPFDI